MSNNFLYVDKIDGHFVLILSHSLKPLSDDRVETLQNHQKVFFGDSHLLFKLYPEAFLPPQVQTRRGLFEPDVEHCLQHGVSTS